jgi:hypothetical protein
MASFKGPPQSPPATGALRDPVAAASRDQYTATP